MDETNGSGFGSATLVFRVKFLDYFARLTSHYIFEMPNDNRSESGPTERIPLFDLFM